MLNMNDFRVIIYQRIRWIVGAKKEEKMCASDSSLMAHIFLLEAENNVRNFGSNIVFI